MASRWSDTATLIGLIQSSEQNENGFYEDPIETKSEVYCNKKSVGRSEFYRAQQNGIQADQIIQVYKDEYDGQPYVERDGTRYKVIRAYEIDNKEYVELTLSADNAEVEGVE